MLYGVWYLCNGMSGQINTIPASDSSSRLGSLVLHSTQSIACPEVVYFLHRMNHLHYPLIDRNHVVNAEKPVLLSNPHSYCGRYYLLTDGDSLHEHAYELFLYH